MSDKKIYMRLEDESEKEKTQAKELEDEQPKEAALDKMIDEVKLEVVDNMVQIAIPEPAFQFLSTLFLKFLELQNSKEKEQEIQR